ncbi:MAG: hypothetical protein QOH88_2568 [Verrucomicrobiota bacterium]|jgi:hypothetical protein
MKLKTGYSDLTPAEGVDLGNAVVTNMTGKPIWAGLAALLTQLSLNITAVTNAMAATGPGAAAQLAAADDALSITLGNIADAANRTPAVTDADLAGTGLPQMKQRVQLTEPPPAPQNLRLRHGQMPGSVEGAVDPIPGGNVRSYEGQWAPDPNAGPWSDILTFPNSRALKFSDLARGKDTWFRIRARNTVGAGPWSDPATIMVT